MQKLNTTFLYLRNLFINLYKNEIGKNQFFKAGPDPNAFEGHWQVPLPGPFAPPRPVHGRSGRVWHGPAGDAHEGGVCTVFWRSPSADVHGTGSNNVLVEEKQDFAEVKEDEDAGEEKGTGAAAGSENAAPGDEERRIKALEVELAESINDRCPKTMEEVDEVISSIYDALGDGGEGPLSKDDALFALGMSPPPTLYYPIEVLPVMKSLTRVQGRYEEAFKEIGDGSPRLSRAEFLHFAKRCVVAMTTDETYGAVDEGSLTIGSFLRAPPESALEGHAAAALGPPEPYDTLVSARHEPAKEQASNGQGPAKDFSFIGQKKRRGAAEAGNIGVPLRP